MPQELEQRRSAALRTLTRAQRTLVLPGNDAGVRAEAVRQVEEVERELEVLEDLVARASPGSEPATVATLGELQRELRSDEAILSFQLWRRDLSLQAPFPEGRSWLLVLTNAQAFAVRMPDAHQLEPEVRMFLAVLAAQSAANRIPGQALAARLLGTPRSN